RKALYMIHQGMDEANFEKIARTKSAKEAWDVLARSYAGAEKVKKVKLQTLKREYELMQMKNGETIVDYFNKIRCLTNQMKGCGKSMKDKSIVGKILRTLPTKFD